MSGSEPLVIETFIAAKPDLVFKYFVDAERLARWMGETAYVDPTPGGNFELHVHSNIARGEYRIVDPPNRVVFTWGWVGGEPGPGESEVEFRLQARDNGTLVIMTHTGLPEPVRAPHGRGWGVSLPALVKAAQAEASL